MASAPVSVRGTPHVLTLGAECTGVARRPTGGFWARARLRMEVALPGGQRFIGGADLVYVRVYPVARPSPGRAAAEAAPGTRGAAPARKRAGATRSRARS